MIERFDRRAVGMLAQRGDQQATALGQHARGFGHHPRRFFAEGEGVHQQHQVETPAAQIQRVHVAAHHLHVLMVLEALAGGADHARTGVETDNGTCTRCEQLGQHAVTGGDVEYVAGIHQLRHRPCQRFPGAAR